MFESILNTRMRVNRDGTLEIIDPGVEDIPLFKELDPEFKVKISELEGFESPRFLEIRNILSDLTKEEVPKTSLKILWETHDMLLDKRNFQFARRSDLSACIAQAGSSIQARRLADLLDIKIEIAGRLLKNCTLCGHKCEVDRFKDQSGVCGLGSKAYVADARVHIREEPPINPSFNILLRGCSMRCHFCQQHKFFERNTGFTPLAKYIWHDLDFSQARSLSFIGGNPDESIYAILKFLKRAPEIFKLPIVWNTNGYGSPEGYRLLNGIVDVYIPDLKFWSEKCAQRLTKTKNYRRQVLKSIKSMINQNVPVIVRILIIPGHNRCCHIPSLQWLSALKNRNQLQINVMKQYFPDFKIDETYGDMNRKPNENEINEVRKVCHKLRLNYFEN